MSAPRLNHVALSVADRGRSAAFYARHFGLTKRIHDDEHLLIIAPPDGSALLALSDADAPPVAALPRTNHFGFQAATQQEVREARERFEREGLTETEWQDAPGMVRLQVADPDGYRVDLFAY